MRIIGKTIAMIIGSFFLIIAVFEFLILFRGEASLFESGASAIWVYLLRGIASLSCFLLALSLFLFPKTEKPLATLFASTGIAIIVALSYLLLETYLYVPFLSLALISSTLLACDYALSKRDQSVDSNQEH